MRPTSRRKFLKSVTAASVVSTLGGTGLIANAATASCTSYASLEAPAPGMENTLGIIGDLVTAKFFPAPVMVGTTLKTAYMGNGYLTWALALSGQPLRIVANQARDGALVTGTGEADYRKQLDACLAAKVTDIICMGGQQDFKNGVSLDSVKAAWESLIDDAVCANKRVWWLTQTPVTEAANEVVIRIKIDQLNAWMRSKAEGAPSNLKIIDVAHTVSTEDRASDGRAYRKWKDNTAGSDGFTPNNAGAFLMGKAIKEHWLAHLTNRLALASDATDNIQDDPRSYNIMHNSLLGDTGVNKMSVTNRGSGYTVPNPQYPYFPLVFKNGVGAGAAGLAKVSNSEVVELVVTNSGNYTVPPEISFELGTGQNASGIAALGPAGFTPDNRTTISRVPRADAIGEDARLDIQFENHASKFGVNYDYTLAADLIKHIGPKDLFSIRCAVGRPNATDQLAAAGPVIYVNGGAGPRMYDSCGDSQDDVPLPEPFENAVFVTPPMRYEEATNIRSYVYGKKDSAYRAGSKGAFKFGRISGIVEPSMKIAPVVKTAVKFNPGHYVTVYQDWLPTAFIAQDGFNIGFGSNNPQQPTTNAWSGVEKQIRWATLEPEPGIYHWDMVDAWLKYLDAWNAANPMRNPKRLMLYLLTDSYNDLKSDALYLPPYILDAKNDQNEALYHYQPDEKGIKLKYFDGFVQQRLILLGQAIADRYDDKPLFEAFRMDETSPGKRLPRLHPTKLTDYIEGQIHIAAEINRAFKQTMFVMGFNFVADQKLSRAARLFIEAGVGMGTVDIVQSDQTLAAPFASYSYIKAASAYVPSLGHFDGGNYHANTLIPVDLTTVMPFVEATLNMSHICWYRNDWYKNGPNYWNLTAMLNAVGVDWDSVSGRAWKLSTTRPSSISF